MRTDAVVSKSTLSTHEDVVEIARQKMEEHNKQALDGIDADVQEVNGKMCIVHEVQRDDSLPRLSIMYNIDERLIKNMNGLVFTDMIHHKKTLFIPMTEGFRFSGKAKKTENEALEEE